MESLHVSDPRQHCHDHCPNTLRCALRAALHCSAVGLHPSRPRSLLGTGMGPVWEATVQRGSSLCAVVSILCRSRWDEIVGRSLGLAPAAQNTFLLSLAAPSCLNDILACFGQGGSRMLGPPENRVLAGAAKSQPRQSGHRHYASSLPLENPQTPKPPRQSRPPVLHRPPSASLPRTNQSARRVPCCRTGLAWFGLGSESGSFSTRPKEASSSALAPTFTTG